MRILKVVILTDSVSKGFNHRGAGRGDGQSATWLPHLAAEIERDPQLEVTWISLRRDIKTRQKFKFGTLVCIDLPIPLPKLDKYSGYKMAARSLSKEVAKINPDVIHCWGTERPYPAALQMTSIPSLLSFNGVLGKLKELGALPKGWHWIMQTYWEKKWISRAGICSAESKWACDAILSIDPCAKVREVCYGVNPSFYDQKWNPSSENPTILFAGTLCVGKGIDVLVDAFEKLSGRGWICEVAGDGPLRSSLEARNVPGIRWLGLLPWDKLQERLRSAWCLVLPTLADSQPNVVKEARVVGLPVITTRNGGQAEYLLDKKNSLILKKVNTANLEEAISQILDGSIESVRKLGEYGWADDRIRFQTSQTAKAFSKIYQELATSGS